jgi:hypothetical protein
MRATLHRRHEWPRSPKRAAIFLRTKSSFALSMALRLAVSKAMPAPGKPRAICDSAAFTCRSSS